MPRVRQDDEVQQIEIPYLEDLAHAIDKLGLGLPPFNKANREERGHQNQIPLGMGAIEFLSLEIRTASTRVQEGLLAIAAAIRETHGQPPQHG